MGSRTGNPEWKDHPDTSTLVTAARLNAIEGAIDDTATSGQGAKADTALQVGTPVPIVALSGAQTTGATHAGKDLHITASSGVDLTVQTAPAGSVIQVRQSGAGAITCVGDGVTLTAMPGMTLVSAGAGARFAIVYTSTTTADVLGWMVAAA